MSIKKELIVPGTIVVLSKHPSYKFTLMAAPGRVLEGYNTCEIGTEMEILSTPVKLHKEISGKFIKVKIQDQEFLTYYCDFKSCCSVKG